MGGTFDSDIPGTFESATGGTFNPLLSNTAFNIFARTVVKQEKIPFEVESEKERQEREGARKLGLALMELREDAQRRGLPEMSLEEINSFIKEVREDTKRNKGE
jgi:antitoxin component of RelBE/YafQ-DinJ toxin-antitoxin module